MWAGWCSAESHELGGRGSTPGPAIRRDLGAGVTRVGFRGPRGSTARYANWHSGQAESLMPVGSNPTRATGAGTAKRRPVVQWRRHLSYKEETGVRLPPGRLVSGWKPHLFIRSPDDGATSWAAGPTGRRLACNQEIGVRFPGRSIFVDCPWKVAGYGLPDRFAKAASLHGE